MTITETTTYALTTAKAPELAAALTRASVSAGKNDLIRCRVFISLAGSHVRVMATDRYIASVETLPLSDDMGAPTEWIGLTDAEVKILIVKLKATGRYGIVTLGTGEGCFMIDNDRVGTTDDLKGLPATLERLAREVGGYRDLIDSPMTSKMMAQLAKLFGTKAHLRFLGSDNSPNKSRRVFDIAQPNLLVVVMPIEIPETPASAYALPAGF